MLVASGLVTGLNLLLSLVVGVRLLQLGARSSGIQEPALGTYFVVSAFFATIALLAVYGTLTAPDLVLAPATVHALLGFATLGMAIGAAGIYVFTWRTFRPESPAAAAAVFCGCAALVVGFAAEALGDGFVLAIFPGPAHWLGWAGRTAALAWVSVESFRYWALSRRRLALGLADPVVANRFLLWGIWSAAVCVNFASDLGARLVYAHVAGTTTEIVYEVAEPIVLATVSLTMVLGIVSAVTLFLVFFPTESYRRWIAARSPVRA